MSGARVERRPRVVVACALPTAGLDLLRRRCVVEAGGNRPERSWLYERVPGAVAIVSDPSIPIDAQLLDVAGGSLKVVANFGVGYDNIDVEAVRQRGVRATNTPDVLTNATAELAIALMLAAARRIAEADALVRNGGWLEEDEVLGREAGRGAASPASTYGCCSARARRAASSVISWRARTSSVFTCRSPPRRGT